MKNIQLRIDGMTCQGCVRSIEQALLQRPDISDVKVDLNRCWAGIEGNASVSELVRIVEDLGFDAAPWQE